MNKIYLTNFQIGLESDVPVSGQLPGFVDYLWYILNGIESLAS